MEAKELMAQLVDIIEEYGNIDIYAEVLGHTHEIEIKRVFPETEYEHVRLEVKP